MSNYKRLIVSQFLLGMMFFYGIEQLFINNALGDAAARGPITIAFTLGVLLFDIPTGILADKFGRKLCLLLGCLIGLISLVTMGNSHTVATYLVGALLYGLFISFHNGSLEALIYDWLASTNSSKHYARYQGSIWAAYLIGAGVANVASGFLATALSLRATYFLSLVPVIAAGLLLTGLKEPKAIEARTSRGDLRRVWRLLITKPRLIAFGLQFIAAEVLFLTVGEFGQLYILSFGVGTVALGILWAIDALFAAAGRVFAYRLQSRPRRVVAVYCLLLGIFAFIHHEVGIGLFWLIYGMTEMVQNIAETEIQHETPTDIRATLLSSVSFVGNLLGIPILVVYTVLLKHGDVFMANGAVIAFCVVMLLSTLLVRPPSIKPNDDDRVLAPNIGV